MPRDVAASCVLSGVDMRIVMRFVACAVAASILAGCTPTQVGPVRPITIADDVERTRVLAAPELSDFYSLASSRQADVRNQIVTARMYIADMEYHDYEARLTREMQDEGFLATAANLGLTTASTLFTPTQTKTILSGVATAVTGLDKTYNEKVLLSNTMQALQAQMRADRKTQAAVIFAKMFKNLDNNTKILTPIAEYTLPMALSDADAYYQAGTIASALVGLSKTVANADQSADLAKSQKGPNPISVTEAKILAAPISAQAAMTQPVRPIVIRNVNEPLIRIAAPKPVVVPTRLGNVVVPTRLGNYEQRSISSKDMRMVLDVLCRPRSESDLGAAGSPARKTLAQFLQSNGKPPAEMLDPDVFSDILELKGSNKKAC